MHGRSSNICPQGDLALHEAAPRSAGGADLLQQGLGHRGPEKVLGQLAEPDPPQPRDRRWDVVLQGQPDLGLCPLCSGTSFRGGERDPPGRAGNTGGISGCARLVPETSSETRGPRTLTKAWGLLWNECKVYF